MERTVNRSAYKQWRHDWLSSSWSGFSDEHINDKDVLDFGCGDGQLALFLASEKKPNSIIGVDLVEASIDRANASLRNTSNIDDQTDIKFAVGTANKLPVENQAFDTILAFDCLEHVMEPAPIFDEWFRVLKPGGHCLIEWFPYKGPWGPHMEALIPIPWAHLVFGQKAMFRAAEKIYDSPDFVPRHWDLDEAGNKKPNKWKNWSSFKEQDYINELDIAGFRQLASNAGFEISNYKTQSFTGSTLQRRVGTAMMKLPFVGEYFLSNAKIELRRPL